MRNRAWSVCLYGEDPHALAMGLSIVQAGKQCATSLVSRGISRQRFRYLEIVVRLDHVLCEYCRVELRVESTLASGVGVRGKIPL